MTVMGTNSSASIRISCLFTSLYSVLTESNDTSDSSPNSNIRNSNTHISSIIVHINNRLEAEQYQSYNSTIYRDFIFIAMYFEL